MLNSLALTDALLCLVAVWLASRSALSVGYRMAFTLLAIPALLGFLRFSGIYPLETWHPLFTLMSASAALPMLAICVLSPESMVATRRQFAIIFLGGAMLLGLLIAGLGKLRIYDQALALFSMLSILVSLLKRGEHMRAMGAILMLAGSALFDIKFSIPPSWVPGDFLHLAMAFGLFLVAPNNLKTLKEFSAPETA